MADNDITIKGCETLVARLRRYLDPGTMVAIDDQFLSDAREFDQTVKHANERLQECDGLLRDGYRAEAIHRCEEEPELLQLVTTLESVGVARLTQRLKNAKQPVPPSLSGDVAGDLNAAYVTQQRLAPLLRLHRLHALAGSPLAERIRVLRALAVEDPENPLWPQDLLSYERERIRQITDELPEIERTLDAVKADKMAAEIASPDWREKPQPALVERVKRTRAKIAQTNARNRLRTLADLLRDAASREDESQASQLRLEWTSKVNVAAFPSDAPIFAEVTPVFEWLDQLETQRENQRKYEEAKAELEAALYRNAPQEELERAYNEVRKWGDVPTNLDAMVQTRGVRHDRRRSARWIGATAVTIVLMIIATVGLWRYIQKREETQRFNKTVAQLRSLADEGKDADVRRVLETLREKYPQSYDSPELQRIRADLEARERAEQDRVAARDMVLKSIRDAVRRDDWNELEQAYVEGTKAENLSRNEVEKREVQDLVVTVRAAIVKHQAQRDAEFQASLKQLAEDVAANSGERSSEIAELKQRAQVLQQSRRVSPELLRQVQPLIARLDGMITSVVENKRQATALERVRLATGNPAGFTSALNEYALAFPNTARGATFAKLVSDEAPIWQRVDKWNAFLQRWSAADFRQLDPKKARAALAEAENMLQTGDHPAAESIKELLPFLAAVVQRVDDADRPIYNDLLMTLDDDRVARVNMLITAAGRRYYFGLDEKNLPSPNIAKPGEWVVFHFTKTDLSDTVRVSIPDQSIANKRIADGFDWISPQRRFRDAARAILDKVTDPSWDAAFVRLLEELESEAQTMEPTLRLHLVKQVVDIGARGSHSFAEGFRAHQMKLGIVNIDINANWISPDAGDGAAAREKSIGEMKRLAPLSDCKQTIKTVVAKLAPQPRGDRMNWDGFLLRNAAGAWAVEHASAGPSGSETFAVALPDETGSLRFHFIGRMAAGRLQVNPKAESLLAEGRPVYSAIAP